VKSAILHIILILLFNEVCKPAIAQTNNWEHYLVKYNNKPASILVDLSLAEKKDLFQYPFIVVTGPKMSNCGQSGIPNKTDIAAMEEILDATDHCLKGLTAQLLAGTLTYECERLNHYYVKDTANIRNGILRMYRRNYPQTEFIVKIKPDPSWTVYHNVLYPTEAMINEAENNGIITAMLSKGDSLRGERSIKLAAYFDTDSAQQNFNKDIALLGCKLYNQKRVEHATTYYLTIAETRKPIVTDTINNITWVFRQAVKKHNGSYLKWGCQSE
jgi:hypothetical protein